jgi:hypothetical protein
VQKKDKKSKHMIGWTIYEQIGTVIYNQAAVNKVIFGKEPDGCLEIYDKEQLTKSEEKELFS